MASKEINDFTEQTILNATDEALIQETGGGTTKKTLVSTLRDYILGYVTSLSAKATVVDADEFLINDSAASGAEKKVLASTIKTYLSSIATPAGVVAPFAGSGSVPSGYLLCDGTAVSRTTYSTLFTAIGTTYGVGDGSTTFDLPDFQGYFLRGFESGVSAAIGTAQADAFQDHIHNIRASGGTSGLTVAGESTGTSVNGRAENYGGTTTNPTTETSGAATDVGGALGTPKTDTETRPKNYAVQYIIKT